MSKLPSEHKFLDLSDYGRLPAKWIANALKKTRVTAIHITTLFIIVGIFAILMMLTKQLYVAAILLIIKSIYFSDLESQTTPVKTKLIVKNGFNKLNNIYFKKEKFLIFITFLLFSK